MTTTTQPTDTEMLDWMIQTSASVFEYGSKWLVFVDEDTSGERYDCPRAAIAAEMTKEAK